MAKTFKSVSEVKTYMNNKIIKILNEIAQGVKEELYDKVKERLYDAWTPKQYERTEELLESISKTEVYQEDGFYCVKIFYDTDKILSYPSLSNLTGNKNEYGSKWGQHADFYGNDTSEYIPLWIEEGTKNNPFPRKGINAMSDEKKWIEENFNKIFRNKLKQYGINSI